MKYKLSLLLNIVLIVLLGAGAYKVMIVGSVEEYDDGRSAILLDAGERDFILEEMRGFLEAVQGITAAVSDNDLEAISEIARSVGMATAESVPVPTMAKLPIDFKTNGMATHTAFDDIALEAENMGDVDQIISQLGELMLNCTGCHAGYRFAIEEGES